MSKSFVDYLKLFREKFSHEEVTINSDGVKEKVVIRGLDDYGYLQVQTKRSGKIFSVHDDGNTFDMMKGLIRPKLNS